MSYRIPKIPKQFKTPTTRDAYRRGYDRGYNVASWQDLPEIGETVRTDSDGKYTVDADNLWDTVQAFAYQGEENDRSFSPFEFTAHEFNSARNAEARWEAFNAGISDGISANIETRKAAYTPEPAQEDDDAPEVEA
jgi:hypothetical protein